MRPYPRGSKQNRLAWPERIFNYRLSRARHISENDFGILVQRWRLFNRTALMPENVDLIVMACVVLHNFLAEQRDIPTLYQRLNPDNIPYLRDDVLFLQFPICMDITPLHKQRQSGISIQHTSIGLKEHLHGSIGQIGKANLPKDFDSYC